MKAQTVMQTSYLGFGFLGARKLSAEGDMANYRKTTPEATTLRREGGQWLKSLRNAAELTQVQVAEKLGYGYYTFIGQIEMGRSRIPPEDWDGWARLYGVPRKRFAMTLLSYYDPRVHAMLVAPDE